MSTYASQKNVEQYIENWTTTDPFALERLIQRSEAEIDRLIFPVNDELPPTQVVSITGATGGTFTVNFGGQVSSPVALGDGAALQAALQALPTIGAGKVTVLGSNPHTLVWDLQWAETGYTNFNVPVVAVGLGSLTGAPVADVAVVPGRKINPLVDLDANQALHLAYATCAQVEYRNAMGERFFRRPQFKSVKGPDFTTQGTMPMIGPKVKRELSGTGLILRGGRAVISRRRTGVQRGWPTV